MVYQRKSACTCQLDGPKVTKLDQLSGQTVPQRDRSAGRWIDDAPQEQHRPGLHVPQGEQERSVGVGRAGVRGTGRGVHADHGDRRSLRPLLVDADVGLVDDLVDDEYASSDVVVLFIR